MKTHLLYEEEADRFSSLSEPSSMPAFLVALQAVKEAKKMVSNNEYRMDIFWNPNTAYKQMMIIIIIIVKQNAL